MNDYEILMHHLCRSLHRDLEVPMSALALAVDDDGDLCIPYHGRTLWATLLVEDSVTWARVWTVAATGLKRTAKLLREINEINVAIRACRALLTDGGQLIVAAEIICASLEPGELTQVGSGRVVRGAGRRAGAAGPWSADVQGGERGAGLNRPTWRAPRDRLLPCHPRHATTRRCRLTEPP